MIQRLQINKCDVLFESLVLIFKGNTLNKWSFKIVLWFMPFHAEYFLCSHTTVLNSEMCQKSATVLPNLFLGISEYLICNGCHFTIWKRLSHCGLNGWVAVKDYRDRWHFCNGARMALLCNLCKCDTNFETETGCQFSIICIFGYHMIK